MVINYKVNVGTLVSSWKEKLKGWKIKLQVIKL